MTNPNQQPPTNPHTSCPPQPPIKERPTITINNYSLALLVLVVVIITRVGYRFRSLSTFHKK